MAPPRSACAPSPTSWPGGRRRTSSAAEDGPRPHSGEAGGSGAGALPRLGLRATLHAIFTAIADGRAPGAGDLRSLNRSLRVPWCAWPSPGSRGVWLDLTDTPALVGLPGRSPVGGAPAHPDDVARVGRCANEDCGWLFVDRSRRHNRRWCEMRECGSRARPGATMRGSAPVEGSPSRSSRPLRHPYDRPRDFVTSSPPRRAGPPMDQRPVLVARTRDVRWVMAEAGGNRMRRRARLQTTR
jgi:hypothetical protein